jgi:hypothetical protein
VKISKCEKYKDTIIKYYKSGLSTNKIREILTEKIAASTIVLFLKKENVPANNYIPAGCFKKGHETWNKGIKSGTPKSAFKKGDIPVNKREVTWKEDINGCWICTSHKPGKQGYPRCTVGHKQKRLNRIMYEKYYGPIPDGLQVCHKCDNRMCIRPDHFFLGTQADNNRDMYQKHRNGKTGLQGEKHPMAKLTARQVREIRTIKERPRNEISKAYNISLTNVYDILNRKIWKNI